jgi:hypothetical protein
MKSPGFLRTFVDVGYCANFYAQEQEIDYSGVVKIDRGNIEVSMPPPGRLLLQGNPAPVFRTSMNVVA